MNDTAKRVAVWITGALLLVIVAEQLPKFTIWLVLLILAGVILTNGDVYVKFLQDASSTVNTKGSTNG